MTQIDLDDFSQEVECTYYCRDKGERYSVRDNGAVFRHPREGKPHRPMDSKWTFGKPNKQKGYLEIASVTIHRIVATAFHGEPPTPEHVVDHIDTNRQNNRPENLRWLTKLENSLNNPITRRRIEINCGSIDAFIKDPSILAQSNPDPNIEWMRTVTPEEAQSGWKRIEQWAKSGKAPSGGSLGEWVYKPLEASNQQEEPVQPVPLRDRLTPIVIAVEKADHPNGLVMAKTLGAAQRDWKTPSEFPCCPHQAVKDPIRTYADNLKAGSIFARNDFSVTTVLEVAILEDAQSLLVMCGTGSWLKPWALARVSYEDGLYIHTNLRAFFEEQGAKKYFNIEQGFEWSGGDGIDDYC